MSTGNTTWNYRTRTFPVPESSIRVITGSELARLGVSVPVPQLTSSTGGSMKRF